VQLQQYTVLTSALHQQKVTLWMVLLQVCDVQHCNVQCCSVSLASVVLQGRCHPVQLLYLEEPTNDYVQRTIDTIVDIHRYCMYCIPHQTATTSLSQSRLGNFFDSFSPYHACTLL